MLCKFADTVDDRDVAEVAIDRLFAAQEAGFTDIVNASQPAEVWSHRCKTAVCVGGRQFQPAHGADCWSIKLYKSSDIPT